MVTAHLFKTVILKSYDKVVILWIPVFERRDVQTSIYTADPENILEELPSLTPFVRFDSLITVVDGRNVQKILTEYPVVRSQITNANLLILNKIDLMDTADTEVVKEALSKINPRAPILPCSPGNINPSILFSLGSDMGFSPKKQPPLSYENHHVPQHLESFEIVTVNLPGIFSESGFIDFLNKLPGLIYRVKGVIKIEGYQKPQLLQYVGGHYELTHFLDTTIQPNALVFIGQGFDKNTIETALKALITR